MGFFTGPSNQWLDKVALGICSNLFQLVTIEEMDEHLRPQMKENLASQGMAVSMEELINVVAQLIRDHDMGTWTRGKFLAKIQNALLQSGVDRSITEYFVGMINTKARA